ncbi:hypothetical protein SAMN05444414_12421 [Roseovarius marisflavi]|uniref:Pentapeptide repeat-containing protein n=1 Tax=Roseovarius marisflavi TaxID=1054996 RepID=A0A1M7CB41_9RHOB|nr:hypothetical protein SAMN05444414_12421 [Roseovarius marisflavi]
MLDFEGCTTRLNLALHHCFFRDGLVFRDAELGGLYLTGSRAEQRVDLHRLTTKTDVHLRGGFHATGLVNLGGARIGGQLSCSGGRFDGTGGTAINCNAARIRAGVFLKYGFHASRRVNFRGARIDGTFEVLVATLEGGIDLGSSQIKGRFFWQNIQGLVPVVDLTEAQVRVLVDDLPSWDKVTELHLSGFTYERIQSGMGIADRLEWLDGKRERKLPTEMHEKLRAQPWLATGSGFDPQPYTQLARVLEDQGNRGGAARVREVRESKLRVAEQSRAFGRVDGTFRAAFGSIPAMLRRLWDFMFRWMFGYGHQPARALVWVTGIWLLAFLLYSSVYAAGQMAPNSDVILTSADWLEIAKAYKAGDEMPMHAWLNTPAARDYETFSAGLYALDLFLPLDALGQEAAWAPSLERGALGVLGYWMRMPIQLAGWVITAVGAAVLTGLVGRKE